MLVGCTNFSQKRNRIDIEGGGPAEWEEEISVWEWMKGENAGRDNWNWGQFWSKVET